MQTKTLSLTRILLLCGVIAGPLFILIVQQACNVNWLDGRIRDRHKAFLCSGYDSTDARPLAQDISLRQTCKDSKMQAKRDTPERMFVTCFYAILEPASGKMRYANAGHDLPYQRHEGSVCELRATGMPLGLMPGMSYEEKETTLMPGDSVLFYSDGLVEAHNPNSEMFGFPRLMSLLKERMDDSAMTHFLLDHLK